MMGNSFVRSKACYIYFIIFSIKDLLNLQDPPTLKPGIDPCLASLYTVILESFKYSATSSAVSIVLSGFKSLFFLLMYHSSLL